MIGGGGGRGFGGGVFLLARSCSTAETGLLPSGWLLEPCCNNSCLKARRVVGCTGPSRSQAQLCRLPAPETAAGRDAESGFDGDQLLREPASLLGPLSFFSLIFKRFLLLCMAAKISSADILLFGSNLNTCCLGLLLLLL